LLDESAEVVQLNSPTNWRTAGAYVFGGLNMGVLQPTFNAQLYYYE